MTPNNIMELGWTKENIDINNTQENIDDVNLYDNLNNLGQQEKRIYLLEAIAEKNIEKIKKILDVGVDLKFKVSKKMKLSSYCLKFFNEDVCNLLAKKISFKDKVEGLSIIYENDDVDAFKWFKKYNNLNSNILKESVDNLGFNLIDYFYENCNDDFYSFMNYNYNYNHNSPFIQKIASKADKYEGLGKILVSVVNNSNLDSLNNLKKHIEFIKNGRLGGFYFNEISKYSFYNIKLKRKNEVYKENFNFAEKLMLLSHIKTNNLSKDILNNTDFIDNLIKDKSLKTDLIVHDLICSSVLDEKLNLFKNYKDDEGNNIAHLLFMYNVMNNKLFNQVLKINEELFVEKNNEGNLPFAYCTNKREIFEKMLLQKSIKEVVKENKNIKTNSVKKRKM